MEVSYEDVPSLFDSARRLRHNLYKVWRTSSVANGSARCLAAAHWFSCTNFEPRSPRRACIDLRRSKFSSISKPTRRRLGQFTPNSNAAASARALHCATFAVTARRKRATSGADLRHGFEAAYSANGYRHREPGRRGARSNLFLAGNVLQGERSGALHTEVYALQSFHLGGMPCLGSVKSHQNVDGPLLAFHYDQDHAFSSV